MTIKKRMTRHQALEETVKLWEHIAKTGCSKIMATNELGMHAYNNWCPLCEYVDQQESVDGKGKGLADKCKEFCPLAKRWKGHEVGNKQLQPVLCELSNKSEWIAWCLERSHDNAMAIANLARDEMNKIEREVYTTKPIDYTGCNEVIRNFLEQGQAVKCRVWDDDPEDTSLEWIIGYSEKSNYKYISQSMAFKHAIPVKAPVVKSAVELMKQLFYDEYTVNKNGDWTSTRGGLTFNASMWQYCSRVPNQEWNWEPQWLKPYMNQG